MAGGSSDAWWMRSQGRLPIVIAVGRRFGHGDFRIREDLVAGREHVARVVLALGRGEPIEGRPKCARQSAADIGKALTGYGVPPASRTRS